MKYRNQETHLASVGLYVTSYFSTCSTWLVLQDTRTDVGFRNITVIFSGTPGIPVTEPGKINIYKFDNGRIFD